MVLEYRSNEFILEIEKSDNRPFQLRSASIYVSIILHSGTQIRYSFLTDIDAKQITERNRFHQYLYS